MTLFREAEGKGHTYTTRRNRRKEEEEEKVPKPNLELVIFEQNYKKKLRNEK